MRIEATISFRPFPENAPPEDGSYTVLYDIDNGKTMVTSMGYWRGKWCYDGEDELPVEERMDHSEWVRAYALPADIEIKEPQNHAPVGEN